MRLSLRNKQRHLAVEVEPQGRGQRVCIDGVEHLVQIQRIDASTVVVSVDGRSHRAIVVRHARSRLVSIGGEPYEFVSESAAPTLHSVGVFAPPEITAPMPGKIVQMLVHSGDHVAAGDGLVILEAMKMENRLVAESAGTVAEVRVAAGDMVDGGQVLVVLQYDEASP